MHRGTAIPRPDPGPFHCLVCRMYVTGTPSGHCPRCGFVPPTAPVLPATSRRVPLVARILAVALLAAIIVASLLTLVG